MIARRLVAARNKSRRNCRPGLAQRVLPNARDEPCALNLATPMRLQALEPFQQQAYPGLTHQRALQT